MAENTFDVAVIGSGPGGYVCAIRAAQNGLKTALIEKDKTLGGTCLNIGCIPSKALLHSTEMYHFLHDRGAHHGIQHKDLQVDIGVLMKHKDAVVSKLVGGVKQLVEARKITIFHGSGSLAGEGKVDIAGEEKKATQIAAKHIVLAAGSVPVELPFMKFDGKTVVSSTEAIAFEKVPANLVVVGGGAIGLELGSVWARLGSDVTVVELLPKIAPTFDEDVSKMALRIFKKQGLAFELGAKVTGVENEKKKTFLTAERDGEKLRFEADKILVCVGRRPCPETLNLDKAGVELDDKRRVKVNAHFATNVPGVYAIGDLIAGPMLAHKAEEDGVALADHLAGKYAHADYTRVPNVIYTEPEVASVGLGEAEAKEAGHQVKSGKFALAANGRAIATDATDGFIKVIADAETDRVLGVQMIAKNASELIAAAVTHMEYGASTEDIARTITAHPTLGESFKEAALAADKAAIHSL
ncbi:MAG: dihydrolipoyl dehydrogenase [Opitutales bacterium]